MKLSAKEKTKKEGRKKLSGSKLFVRIMALLLAALMLLGGVVMILQFFGVSSRAYENDAGDTVRVGLMYGSGVTVGFEVRAPHGFSFGKVVGEGENFEILWQTDETCVSVTCDANLSKSGMTYGLTSSSSPAVGGYHLETEAGLAPAGLYETVRGALASTGYDVFPAYRNGSFAIRVGRFSSAAQADEAAAVITSLTGCVFSAAEPSDTAVSVIVPETDTILFEYDGAGESELGLCARQDGGETAYLTTPAKNTYSGIFEFSRYSGSYTEGVQLVNIVPLEEYVEGVIPWEIGTSWPIEVQKAFAIAVRTYAIGKHGRHSEYHFDVCNGDCCQCYKGRNRTTETVMEAVRATKDRILTYDGKCAETYYSSSTGGTTVGIGDAWGTTASYPYLQAVPTPWEKYDSYLNGSWTAEMTPKELQKRLTDRGYTSLGEIVSVEIEKLAENSTYVASLIVTDASGNSVTVRRSDTIRSVLGLKSANFVVAKAGETVTVTDYRLASEVLGDGSTVVEETLAAAPQTVSEPQTSPDLYTGIFDPASVTEGVHVMAGSSERIIGVEESVSTVRSIGGETLVNLSDVSVITASGRTSFDMASESDAYYDLLDEFYASYAPSVSAPEATQGISSLAEFSDLVRVHRTVTAEGTPGSFVFIGRGWGHGVGMSQWGAKDLSDLGYTYAAILQAYFPGTVITDLHTGLPLETDAVAPVSSRIRDVEVSDDADAGSEPEPTIVSGGEIPLG